MTKILIVGASPAGLHLAHGLLTHGYDVTMLNARTSGEIRTSQPSTTQFSLPTALAHEQQADLARWEHVAPRISGARLHLHPPNMPTSTVESAFSSYGVSVDHRVKIADWLEYLEDRGAKVVIHGVTVGDLDYFSRMFDLVILAIGYGELGALFDRHTSGQAPPPRAVAQAIIEGVHPSPHVQMHPVAPPRHAPPGYLPEPVASDYAEVASTPELRAILSPVLTDVGPQHVLQLVGAPGGPMEGWPDRPRPEEIWRWMSELTAKHTPHLHQRLEEAYLPASEQDASVHAYTPHVRAPVATLPSGGHVLGMAEAVVSTDDPVAAQAGNMAIASSQHYLARILHNTQGPFTPAWMHETFEGLWQGEPTAEYPFAGMGQACLGLSQVLDQIWDPQAPAHLTEVLGAAATHQQVADRFLGDLDDPRRYTWLYEPENARAYLNTLT